MPVPKSGGVHTSLLRSLPSYNWGFLCGMVPPKNNFSLVFACTQNITSNCQNGGSAAKKKVLWHSAQWFRSLFWGCGLRIDLLPWIFWIPWTPFVGVGTWGCKSHRHQKSPGQTKAPLLQGWQTHLLSVAAHSVVALCSNTAAAQVKLGGGLAVNLAFGLLFRDKLAWIFLRRRFPLSLFPISMFALCIAGITRSGSLAWQAYLRPAALELLAIFNILFFNQRVTKLKQLDLSLETIAFARTRTWIAGHFVFSKSPNIEFSSENKCKFFCCLCSLFQSHKLHRIVLCSAVTRTEPQEMFKNCLCMTSHDIRWSVQPATGIGHRLSLLPNSPSARRDRVKPASFMRPEVLLFRAWCSFCNDRNELQLEGHDIIEIKILAEKWE